MKDSGVEWIGTIPGNWSIIPMKSMFSFSKGLPITKADLVEKGIPVISYGQIHSKRNTGIRIEDEFIRYVPIEYRNTNPQSQANEGDILFADTSEDYDGIGNCIRVDGERELYAGYHTIIARPKESRFSKYWAFLFQTDSWRSQLRLQASGIKVFSITQKMLNGVSVIIPSLKDGTCIADYLDAKCAKIDALIAKQQEIIEKLKAYKLSVITEAVTKGLNPNVPMKDSGIKYVAEIPPHWENRKMISILSMRVVDGPHESPELFDEGIPYISATAIEDGKINFSKMRGYISEEYCDQCDQRYKPQLNDILVIKLGASTGQVAMVETTERFNIWVPLAVVRCNQEANPRFVYYAFQSDYFIKQMEQSWTYGTQQTLGVKTIERLRVLMPSLEEQNEIAEYLDKKSEIIRQETYRRDLLIGKLEQYKKSLIYEVVTGKREV